MCQLWVNLPKKKKMVKPGYQAILNENIPVVPLPLGTPKEDSIATARIIAGELGDTKGAAKTHSPVQLWDVNLPNKGSTVDLPFPADHNCIVFVRRGSVEVVGEKSTTLGPHEVAIMALDGSDTLRLNVQ